MATRAAVTACVPVVRTQPANKATKFRNPGAVNAGHDALTGAGGAVTLDRGDSLIHGYLRAKAYCDRSRLVFERMGVWLREACAGTQPA